MSASGRDAVYVAVIGPSAASADELVSAERIGALLAERGAIVVCGGHGGVMEAVCKGAALGGGQTIGLLPGTERAAGNPYLGIVLPTGLGELRNGLIVRAADTVIAVGGSWGTLSEIALAVRTGKPVIALGGWRVERIAPGPERAPDLPGPIPADSPEHAVALALASITHST
jgi:uncharacterized protein (TIGR00725 family)